MSAARVQRQISAPKGETLGFMICMKQTTCTEGCGPAFTCSKKRDRVPKSQSHAMCQSPTASRSIQHRTYPNSQHRTYPFHAAEGTQPFPLGDEMQKAGGVHDSHWFMCLRRTKQYVSSWEQRKISPRKAISPVQIMRALNLPVRKYSKLKPILLRPRWGQMTTRGRLPFPTAQVVGQGNPLTHLVQSEVIWQKNCD